MKQQMTLPNINPPLRMRPHHYGLFRYDTHDGRDEGAPAFDETPSHHIEAVRKEVEESGKTVHEALSIALGAFKVIACGEGAVELPFINRIDALMHLVPRVEGEIDWICVEEDGVLTTKWVADGILNAILDDDMTVDGQPTAQVARQVVPEHLDLEISADSLLILSMGSAQDKAASATNIAQVSRYLTDPYRSRFIDEYVLPLSQANMGRGWKKMHAKLHKGAWALFTEMLDNDQEYQKWRNAEPGTPEFTWSPNVCAGA